MEKKSDKQVLKIFRAKKVMTKDDLLELLNCSNSTLKRRLVAWKAITSYNQNSRYYTLLDIPCFNEYGIWHFHSVSFSKYGNLSRTVIQLVSNSDMGLTGRELGKILDLVPSSFLYPFKTDPRICRKKINGRFVYLSVQKQQFQWQINRRLEREMHAQSLLPSDADAVIILVELIKHPAWTFDELVTSLQQKDKMISRAAIEQLLVHHDLKKKLNMPTKKS
jgi:hypothetical protein